MMSPDPTDPYRTVLPMAYRCLDQAVGRLQAAAGPETTVFVVSECGAGPIRYGVQINTWLCQQGFLTRKRAGVARPGRWSGPVSSIFKRGVRLGSGFAKHHLPQSIRFWLNQLLPSLKGSQADSALRGVDWARTKAFAQGKEGHLFINLRGRDPKGIVAPGAEYETVRQDLIDRLGTLRDPDTGEPAVTRVCRREELFEGPMVHLAADLFIEWRDDMYMPAEQELEPQKVFVTRYRQGMSWPTSGSHRVAGVLIASGPLIRPASEVLDATIFDLLPTWLRLLEQPIPEELEGRVLDEALN
jgi:predicted AlkP superfamily phosphohydrolase/phosphomutase